MKRLEVCAGNFVSADGYITVSGRPLSPDLAGALMLRVWLALILWGTILSSSLAAQESGGTAVAAEKIAGVWRASLESGGGPVEFGLILAAESGPLQAFVTNGPETIKIPQVNWDGNELRLGFDHFQSSIVASVTAEGRDLAGSFSRQKVGRVVAQMRFTARREEPRDRQFETADRWLGKWQVQFGSSDEPVVGLFRRDRTAVAVDSGDSSQPGQSSEAVVGTFLTPTGDYRYLAGGVRDGVLRLSCFDGTHVYLFHCRVDGDRIEGDFWSGTNSHLTWVGKRDEAAVLPDAFELTVAREEVDWGSLQFPDLQGRPRRLDDPEFVGRARLIYLFGSWCPNCHDAAVFFGELQKRYGDGGLKVLGLAFEASGDFPQDKGQVEIYARRHAISYPLLVAGLADKELASRSLPFLDRVRSFPTAILVDSKGRIRGVYTGFSGPATGEAYTEQERRFCERIEVLLSDKPD